MYAVGCSDVEVGGTELWNSGTRKACLRTRHEAVLSVWRQEVHYRYRFAIGVMVCSYGVVKCEGVVQRHGALELQRSDVDTCTVEQDNALTVEGMVRMANASPFVLLLYATKNVWAKAPSGKA